MKDENLKNLREAARERKSNHGLKIKYVLTRNKI